MNAPMILAAILTAAGCMLAPHGYPVRGTFIAICGLLVAAAQVIPAVLKGGAL